MIPSCILLNPATKADLQAACVQAEAAWHAGDLTYQAGLLACVAAVFASLVAFLSVQRQIRATQREAAKQRGYDLKSQVYIPAVKAVSTGLFVATKLADVTVPVGVALAGHQEKLPEIFAVHLVAEMDTAAKLLLAVHALQGLQQSLISEAVAIRATPWTVEQLIAWAKRCTDEVERAIPPTVAFVAAMRSELGVPTDEEQYKKLIRCALKAALDRNKQTFDELLARHGKPRPGL